MKKIAFLASEDILPYNPHARVDCFECQEQMQKCVPAFAAQGLSLDLISWRSAVGCAGEYAAMLPLFVWDYFETRIEFLAEMAQVDRQTQLLNSYEVIDWNSDKTYLQFMAQKGVPVIETLNLDRLTPAAVEAAFTQLDCDKLVIKPLVGGGAWRQVLQVRGAALPPPEQLPPDVAMLQAFLPSVQTEGEYSFVYFEGIFSHALVKRPKAGDYRIQSLYGGREVIYTPTQTELDGAQHILQALDFVPLYARVDLLRGHDGELKLIELEMVEPYLYLPYAEGQGEENHGAQMLAKALRDRLSNH